MNAPPSNERARGTGQVTTGPEPLEAKTDATSSYAWKYKFPLAVHSSFDDAGLTAEEFRVMAAICRKCGDETNGRQCDSTIATLAKVCRLHPDTVRKALAHLKELEWIEVIDRPGRTKVHIARFPNPSVFKGGLPLQGRGLVSVEGLPLEGVHPFALEGVHPSGFKGDKGIPLRESKKGSPPEPLPFSSEAFREAWRDWEKHRREIKKPLTPTSAKQQLRNFTEWGEERSIAAIRFTIGNGWQGIREPDAARNSTPATRHELRTDQLGI